MNFKKLLQASAMSLIVASMVVACGPKSRNPKSRAAGVSMNNAAKPVTVAETIKDRIAKDRSKLTPEEQASQNLKDLNLVESITGIILDTDQNQLIINLSNAEPIVLSKITPDKSSLADLAKSGVTSFQGKSADGIILDAFITDVIDNETKIVIGSTRTVGDKKILEAAVQASLVRGETSSVASLDGEVSNENAKGVLDVIKKNLTSKTIVTEKLTLESPTNLDAKRQIIIMVTDGNVTVTLNKNSKGDLVTASIEPLDNAKIIDQSLDSKVLNLTLELDENVIAKIKVEFDKNAEETKPAADDAKPAAAAEGTKPETAVEPTKPEVATKPDASAQESKPETPKKEDPKTTVKPATKPFEELKAIAAIDLSKIDKNLPIYKKLVEIKSSIEALNKETEQLNKETEQLNRMAAAYKANPKRTQKDRDQLMAAREALARHSRVLLEKKEELRQRTQISEKEKEEISRKLPKNFIKN